MSKFIKLIFTLALTLGMWQVCGSTVMAQSNYSRINKPFDRPTFSPYLNLFRQGGGPVSNYFGVVRPQQQFYAQDNEFGEELEGVQKRQQQQYNPNEMRRRIPGVYTMGVTGHAVGFNTIRPNGSEEGGGSSPQLSGFNSPQGGSQFGSNSGQSSFGGGGFGGSNSGSGFGSNSGSGFGSGSGRGF